MTFPLLDVSELLSDPMFVETEMTVWRRRQVLVKGRTTPEVVQIITNVAASVQPKDTAIGGNFTERAPDMEYRGSNLNIYTAFRLRGVTKEKAPVEGDPEIVFLPDVVVWNGDHFLVALTNDWTHYGAGFMHAELASTDPVDYAPDGLNPIPLFGVLDFRVPGNAALVVGL
jgi:hypothetical protein